MVKKLKAGDFNLPYEESEYNQAKDKYAEDLEKKNEMKETKINHGFEIIIGISVIVSLIAGYPINNYQIVVLLIYNIWLIKEKRVSIVKVKGSDIIDIIKKK